MNSCETLSLFSFFVISVNSVPSVVKEFLEKK